MRVNHLGSGQRPDVPPGCHLEAIVQIGVIPRVIAFCCA